MAQIMTVCGPIAPEELGFTSMHEHLIFDASIYRQSFEALGLLPEDPPIAPDEKLSLENVGLVKRNPFLLWDNLRMDDEEAMTGEVADFKASGGDALLEMSVPGFRGDLPMIRRISEKTGLHVVATAGLYVEYAWPEQFRNMTTEQYADYLRKEVEEGIDDTDIRAGHLKGTCDLEPFSEQQEKLLRALVRVSNDTGLPFTVHQWDSQLQMVDDRMKIDVILDALLDEGANPERGIIAHTQTFFFPRDLKTIVHDPSSLKLNLAFPKMILDKGFNISIDFFGFNIGSDFLGELGIVDWHCLAGLVGLIKAGYSSQIVLGTDRALKILMRRFGGEGFCVLTNNIVPTLKDLDVSDADIKRLFVENPARLLSH